MVDSGLLLAKGLIYKNEQFRLNLDSMEVNNPHLLVIGESGSGKTTLMKKIIEDMYLKGKTIFLIDFHGDMEMPDENYIKYTPRQSPNGVNPFELELDEQSGGVIIQAEIISMMLNQYFMDNKLGKKQLNLLKQLIIDTYKLKKIYDSDSNTWTKEVPKMKDLGILIKYIKQVIEKGSFNRNRILNESFDRLNEFLPDDLKETLKDSLKNIEDELKNIEDSEDENDMFADINIEYYTQSSSKRTFDGLFVYLEEIVKMTIFNGEKARIIKGINRLDFSSFTQVNKPLIAKFLAEFTAQKLFRATMLRGNYEDLDYVMDNTRFDRVLIFDESKLALPHGMEKNNPYNIMNRITTEARKFGISLVLASQSLEHYSQEMLSNIFTKIILRVKSNNYKSVAKTLGLKEDFISSTFDNNKGRPAIIETKGTKYSYLIENF